jgi:hypothetical protein
MTNSANAPKRRPLLLWVLVGVLLLVLVAALAVVLTVFYFVPVRSERSDLPAPQPVLARSASPAEFADHNGVEVLMLGVTAEGGLIDVRFQVTDAEKAAFLLEEANRPRLIVEDGGVVLTRHIRPEYKSLETGRIYYLLFANAQNAIRPGSLVTVELDGLRLEHLVAR